MNLLFYIFGFVMLQIWSNSQGVENKPPENLVCKEASNFLFAKTAKTILEDLKGTVCVAKT